MRALTPPGIKAALLTDAIDCIRTLPPDGEAVRVGRAARHQPRQRVMGDVEIVWKTIRDHLPAMRNPVRRVLEERLMTDA